MISFGSDPEFMLVDANKTHKSAIGIIQGDPENRITLKGHQFYHDNVMAECAIKPARSKKKVLENFKECFGLYAQMAAPYQLCTQASQTYPESELRHPMARIAGCEPDCCAYEMVQKKPPKDIIENTGFRSCGGHIHIGHPALVSDGTEPWLTIYMLDLFLGVPSLWLDTDPTSGARRLLYGQSGRYRPKDYGIEYRSLGNFWLKSPRLVSLMFDICNFVVAMVVEGEASEYWTFDEEVFGESETPSDAWTCRLYDAPQLKEGIDKGDKEAVESHYNLARSRLPAKLLRDLDAALKSPSDEFYKAWQIA